MIELSDARERVRGVLRDRAVPSSAIALDDAHGCVLAEALLAARDMPGFAHSAMDGYAVRHADLATDAPTRLRFAGDCRAGKAASLTIAVGECALIATGAALPLGADTVVIRERSSRDGEFVVLEPGTARGANIRGADEDYARGATALAAGTRLNAATLAVAASFGLMHVKVRRPRVAVLITGDELIAPPATLQAGQRYDSNGALLRALLREHGAQTVACDRIGDDPDRLGAWLREHAASADLMLSTGGASMGEADFLPRLVAAHGEVAFHRVRMRPGMPVLFGRIATTPMLVLPGNPVSVAATFVALARPALAALAASAALDPAPFSVRLAEATAKDHARLEFRRARLHIDDEATVWATPHASLGSGALRSVAESDALLELAAPPAHYARGDRVPCRRLLLD